MKYMLLIYQGDTPTPQDPEAWATLSEEEQGRVFADYQAINQTPGVTPGNGLDDPSTATTALPANHSATDPACPACASALTPNQATSPVNRIPTSHC